MWIKICGIRDVQTARDVAELAPDAIGLNFYEPSPRSTSPETAAEIVAALPEETEPIALFVNETRERILAVCAACGVRTVQLHGDETPDFAGTLQGLEVIRAYRVGAGGLPAVAADLEQYRKLGVPLKACLIDARIEGTYGGTGQIAPWDLLVKGWQADWPPLILAGGLTPENVGGAIGEARPWGVDVASGVESSPGVKDIALTARFVEIARRADH